MKKHRTGGVLALLLLFLADVAHADPSPEDRALATELFVRGRELLAEGRTEEACEKLAASHRLDPSGGTILNLALCHETLGRTATAWSELREALSFARRDRREDRLKLAEAHLAAIEPRLARLAIVVDDASAVVVRDGSTLPLTAWGEPSPVDPGRHVVEARAAGAIAFRREITIAEGERVTVRVPRLAPVVLPRRPTPALVHALGLGAAFASAAGTIAGIHAIALRRTSDELCAPRCTDESVRWNERAMTAADVSTTAFIVAGAAAAAAFVVWLYRPARAQ